MARDRVADDHLSPLGERIAAVLERQGRVRGWLQERLGVSRSTLYRMLTGKQEISVRELQEIAKELGVTVAEISGDAPAAKKGDVVRETGDNAYFEVSFASPTAAQKGRIWLEQLLLELAEAGADDDFLSWARRLLLAPMNYALHAGGQREDMDDDQKLRHMQGLAVGVREVLKDRLRKTKAK